MARAKTVLLLALAVSLCLAGCSKKDVPSGSERLTIAVIPKGTIHEFWKTVHAGAEMAGQELDVEILWKGPLKEDDREAQIGVVENIITRKVDGIVPQGAQHSRITQSRFGQIVEIEDPCGEGVPPSNQKRGQDGPAASRDSFPRISACVTCRNCV